MGLILAAPPNTQRDFTDSSEDSDCGLDYHVNKRRQEQMALRQKEKEAEDASQEGEDPKSPENSLSKKLHNEEEIGWKYKARKHVTDFEMLEKKCAQKYIKDLTDWLPSLMTSYSTLEADELIQEFSSNFCESRFSKLL